MRAHILTLLLACLSTVVWASQRFDVKNDTAVDRNYETLFCDSGQYRYQGKKLYFLIPLMQKKIRLVLDDIELGTASKHGFRSLFKTDKYQPHVRSVFQPMAEGTYSRRCQGSRDTFRNLKHPNQPHC